MGEVPILGLQYTIATSRIKLSLFSQVLNSLTKVFSSPWSVSMILTSAARGLVFWVGGITIICINLRL